MFDGRELGADDVLGRALPGVVALELFAPGLSISLFGLVRPELGFAALSLLTVTSFEFIVLPLEFKLEFGRSLLPETLGFHGSELFDNTSRLLRSEVLLAPTGTASLPEIFLFELLTVASFTG